MITACDYALQMFTGHTGCLHVFPALSMEKGCKNHRETPCFSKEKIMHVVGKPFNIYRLLGNPMMIIGFPAICKYHLVSPQHRWLSSARYKLSQLKSHVTPYKFNSSHWMKSQHSDWRANFPPMRALYFIRGHMTFNLA